MAYFAAFPIHRSTPSIPIPPDAAHEFLAEYLDACALNPYLLPNAKLEATGPVAGSAQGGGVVLYGLGRVEKGLRGEFLGGGVDWKIGERGGKEIFDRESQIAKDSSNLGIKGGLGGGGLDVGGGGNTNGEDWEDLDQYQREQSFQAADAVSEEDVEGGKVLDRAELAYALTDGEPPNFREKRREKQKKKHRRDARNGFLEADATENQDEKEKRAAKKAGKEAKSGKSKAEANRFPDSTEIATNGLAVEDPNESSRRERHTEAFVGNESKSHLETSMRPEHEKSRTRDREDSALGKSRKADQDANRATSNVTASPKPPKKSSEKLGTTNGSSALTETLAKNKRKQEVVEPSDTREGVMERPKKSKIAHEIFPPMPRMGSSGSKNKEIRRLAKKERLKSEKEQRHQERQVAKARS